MRHTLNNNQYGYNRRIDCTTNLGLKYSDEHKKKLSESHIGNTQTEETRKKIGKSQERKVYQYSLEGIFINEYSSIKFAAEKYDIQRTGVSMCCRGKIKKSGGFIWSYKKMDTIKPGENYNPNVVGERKKKKPSVLQYDLNGVFIKKWESAAVVVKSTKDVQIYKCLNGSKERSCGFIWKYEK